MKLSICIEIKYIQIIIHTKYDDYPKKNNIHIPFFPSHRVAKGVSQILDLTLVTNCN